MTTNQNNENYSVDRYLQEDLTTAKKIKENPIYYDKLLIADKYIEDLNIESELQFYVYTQVLKDLEGIPYSDVQAIHRFKNEKYYKYVQLHLPPDIKIVK